MMIKKYTDMINKTGVRLLCLVLTLLLLAACLTACGSETGDAGSTVAQTQKTDKAGRGGKGDEKIACSKKQTRTFIDSCGRKVKVPSEIDTVVTSGNVAQIFLFAIVPDRLMATAGSWSKDAGNYVNAKYVNLPEVGSFFGKHDLNYEEIVKLDPDIIIDVGENKPSMKADLEDISAKTGIPAVHIDAYYNNMDKAFLKLGDLLDEKGKGKELSDFCAMALEKAEDTAEAAKKSGGLKSLLYCTQEDGQNVLAKGSVHAAVLDMLSDNKAVLKAPANKGTGNQVDMEQLYNWDPQVILFAPNSYYDFAGQDPVWAVMQAIKKDRYFEVPQGPYNWMGSPPSSNMVLGMLWMSKLLYREHADFNLEALTIDYYDKFYHCELSHEQYMKLVRNSIGKGIF